MAMMFLIRRGGNPYAISKSGLTTLHIAAKSGKLDAVTFLIDTFDLDINRQTYLSGTTPLHVACKYKHK